MRRRRDRAGAVRRQQELAEAMALRGADSVQLASALVLQRQLGVDDQEFTFVGSDRELNAAAVRAGLRVVNPEGAEGSGVGFLAEHAENAEDSGVGRAGSPA